MHVSQIGYRPDDPGKRAYLSLWLGTGGKHSFPEGLPFALIDERDAEDALHYASGNAFNLTTADRYRPLYAGFYTTPEAIPLVRAHALTGKDEYLRGIIRACQFAAGANPDNINLCFSIRSFVNSPSTRTSVRIRICGATSRPDRPGQIGAGARHF